MKHLAAVARVGIAVLAGIAAPSVGSPQTSQAPQQQLLAPVYAGSVRYPPEELGYDLVFTVAFLSKDDMATVKAYYEGELGPFREADLGGLTYGASERSGGYVFSRVLMPRGEVLKYVDFGESGTPEAGVLVAAVEKKPVDDPSDYPVVGPIFEKLGEMLRFQTALKPEGFDVAEGHSRDELDELIERYKELAWRYYLPSDEEKPWTGSRPTMGEVVVERCEQANKLDQEALAARIQQLAMQGKGKEAQKLAMSMAEGGGDTGTWEGWLECLAEVEKHAYRTWIAINEHPSVWRARMAAWEADQGQ